MNVGEGDSKESPASFTSIPRHPMKPKDPTLNVQGKSLFIDDLPVPEGTLYGAVLPSPSPHARILRLHTDKALAAQGVKAVLLAQDIPGQNEI
ncbi:MAG: hypothetical protein D3909_03710, partial [Candidatus Electrothrix sp. ATG1]|nr:hypothetical protein [Candidatus Electrothrix sp. ATG1]